MGPYYALAGKKARYYQEIAINRAVPAVLKGKRRIPITLATGTGKTYIAFQVIWELWRPWKSIVNSIEDTTPVLPRGRDIPTDTTEHIRPFSSAEGA